MARDRSSSPWRTPSSKAAFGLPDARQRFLDPFAEVLGRHSEVLKWVQQTDLAKAADNVLLSTSQISGWFKGERTIHREHVNRLAWVIARAYYDQSDPSAIDALDGILNELLQAAGYSAIQGARDLIWARLAGSDERVLRVGWVDYESFSTRTSPQRDPEGVAASVMEEIAKLMGAKIIWIDYTWKAIITAVVHREVDVVCPILMVLPSRLFQVQFSTVLPDIYLGINGVLHKEYRTRSLGVVPAYITGEVGEEFLSVFAPGANTSKSFKSISDARKELLTSPVIDDARLCLIADNMICANLIAEHTELELLRPTNSRSEVVLPVAVAVHPDEPKLLSMINICMDILRQARYFEHMYKTSSHAKRLKQLGVIRAEAQKAKKAAKKLT